MESTHSEQRARTEKVVSPEAERWIEGKANPEEYFQHAWQAALSEARRDLERRRSRGWSRPAR